MEGRAGLEGSWQWCPGDAPSPGDAPNPFPWGYLVFLGLSSHSGCSFPGEEEEQQSIIATTFLLLLLLLTSRRFVAGRRLQSGLKIKKIPKLKIPNPTEDSKPSHLQDIGQQAGILLDFGAEHGEELHLLLLGAGAQAVPAELEQLLGRAGMGIWGCQGLAHPVPPSVGA